MTRKILGYDINKQPIYPAGKDYIVTQAFILCSVCGKAISPNMGPRSHCDCPDCHNIRLAFEEITCPNFISDFELDRNQVTGEYKDPTLADHWQTFQEGWAAAVDHLKRKTNAEHSDLVSTGGMDPRND